MTARTLNVGIIGFGFIGKVHAFGHLNMPLYYDPPLSLPKKPSGPDNSEKSLTAGSFSRTNVWM